MIEGCGGVVVVIGCLIIAAAFTHLILALLHRPTNISPLDDLAFDVAQVRIFILQLCLCRFYVCVPLCIPSGGCLYTSLYSS